VPEGPLRVWLLSDVLITDGRLRSSTRPEDLAAELGRALGVELHPVDDVDDAGVLGRVSEAHRTESWHRRWGLPRASLLGIAAGSCFSFHLTGGTLTAEALQQVETAGIGLRRAEGFGQVRVDDPLLYAASGSLSGPAERAGSAAESVEFPHAVLDAHGELLDVLEDAAWRNEIRCNSEAVARDRRREVLGEHHENVPPSQIGALRMLVSQITRPDDGRAYAWLKRLRPGAEPRRMWPEATLDGIEELLTAADRVWTILALPEPDITASRDRIRRQRARLWPAAVRTLVEDCLTAHARAAHERGED
jgi:CRISPR-associated protein Csx10